MEYFVKHARIQRAYENNLLIYYREEKEVLNTLFLEGVPDERQNVACSRFRDWVAPYAFHRFIPTIWEPGTG